MRTARMRPSSLPGLVPVAAGLALVLAVACESNRRPGVGSQDLGLPDVPFETYGDAFLDAAVDGRADTAIDDALPDAPPDAPTDGQAVDVPADPASDLPADGTVAGDATDVSPDCPPSEPFDYQCDQTVATDCPRGWCILGQCLAPHMDPNRWAYCADGFCSPCESATGCPADCASKPVMTGTKEYDNATTMTIWVHGFSNKSPGEMASMVYGQDRGCGGLLEDMAGYGVVRPCSDTAEGALAPNQLTKVEYYGGTPAAWMTQADIDEISQYSYETAAALERYARIVAKYIRWKMAVSGATHVNLACHSMGCYVLRFLIEHDLEGLASSNVFPRWFTSAGVIAGARLARLYDNPTVQQAATLFGLLLSDFVIMNPDFDQDWAARWDHRLWEGNTPLLKGTLIHHVAGTDPKIREALGIALLDLDNPADEPNDGIMFTEDEYFHTQGPLAMVKTPSGRFSPATHSLVHEYHMEVPNTPTAALLGAAALFHRRKVTIRVDEFTMYKDRENHTLLDGENGKAPADVTWEVEVRYDPYVHDTFGKDVLVHDDKIAYRSPPFWQQDVNQTVHPNPVLFEGPVFDDQASLRLTVSFVETDWFQRHGVKEWAINPQQALLSFDGQVELKNGTFDLSSEYAHVRLSVDVLPMY